jgi:hypothetical protein
MQMATKKMTRLQLIAVLEKELPGGSGACSESVDWLKSQAFATASECWDACPRGDWMLWLLNATDTPAPEQTIRNVMADCAELVAADGEAWFSQYEPMHAGAITRAIAACRSGTDEERSAAESAAMSAAWSAAESAARSAALSAAESAARSAARSAAMSAAWSAAESAAESAAWSAAESAALGSQADIVRRYVTWRSVRISP